MGCRIVVCARTVACLPDHLTAWAYDHRPYRHFSARARRSCLRQSNIHERGKIHSSLMARKHILSQGGRVRYGVAHE
jgi:hypothetical protein